MVTRWQMSDKPARSPIWRRLRCDGCARRCAYTDFKVFTPNCFREARQELWTNSDNPADWKYKRRSTVLGYMHGVKLKAWIHHIMTCPGADEA